MSPCVCSVSTCTCISACTCACVKFSKTYPQFTSLFSFHSYRVPSMIDLTPSHALISPMNQRLSQCGTDLMNMNHKNFALHKAIKCQGPKINGQDNSIALILETLVIHVQIYPSIPVGCSKWNPLIWVVFFFNKERCPAI